MLNVDQEWDQIFKDPLTTAAAIDRVIHHSLIIEFGKEMTSHRAEEAAKRNRITADCEGAEYGEAGGAGVSPASSLATRADESTAFLVDKTKWKRCPELVEGTRTGLKTNLLPPRSSRFGTLRQAQDKCNGLG